MNIGGFVFDLDGTLVDSKIDFDSMKSELRLNREDDVLEYIETLSGDDRQRALDTVYRHELAGAEAAVRIQGALEFVELAMAAKKPVAIFTRNARALAEACLRSHGFEIDLMIAREDGPPKPKPDGLIKIAHEFGVELRDLLFVGDYVYDLQAGLAAGVRTALYLPVTPDFETHGAEFLFTNYDQLTKRIFPASERPQI